jgi:hypothetical protein
MISNKEGITAQALEIKKQEVFIMWRQMKRKVWGLTGVMIFFAWGLAWAEVGNDKTLSPYLFIENGDPSVDRFPLKETDVQVKINGVIADVVVTKVYGNERTRPIHAWYVFPASTRASVHGMNMTVADQVVTARIQERQQAKREFEKAKREGKSASLPLEGQGGAGFHQPHPPGNRDQVPGQTESSKPPLLAKGCNFVLKCGKELHKKW